ncbi:MAG: inositol monophosphatase family protein [Spirochaeta sp.]|jgi:myo-inositol-1(or 4)-monophosphatase|nr:inositol monophosphatase family protein [Spirochaeta sp.]
MIDWNVHTVRDLLIEAGRIALHHYATPGTEHKHDASLVTVADHAVEEFLTGALVGDDDGALMIGEESVGGTTQTEVDAALTGTTWVVDPIDGTAPYANRLPTWGISIGLLRSGAYTDGALFLPRTGEIFITSGNDVLFEESSANPDHWQFEDLTPMSATPIPYVSTAMVRLPHEIVRSGRFSGRNPMQSIGSAVFSIAKLVQGSYIGYVTGLKLWDIAGAAPILRRMGHGIEFRDRRPLGDHVTDADWVTDASRRELWKCRGNLLIAGSEEAMAYIHAHYSA